MLPQCCIAARGQLPLTAKPEPCLLFIVTRVFVCWSHWGEVLSHVWSYISVMSDVFLSQRQLVEQSCQPWPQLCGFRGLLHSSLKRTPGPEHIELSVGEETAVPHVTPAACWFAGDFAALSSVCGTQYFSGKSDETCALLSENSSATVA